MYVCMYHLTYVSILVRERDWGEREREREKFLSLLISFQEVQICYLGAAVAVFYPWPRALALAVFIHMIPPLKTVSASCFPFLLSQRCKDSPDLMFVYFLI